MTDDDRVCDLLRSTLPPVASAEPSRDLWPLLAARAETRVRWSWADVALAAAAGLALLLFPGSLWLLAFHL